MIASEQGHVEVVKSLIEAGANINHTNKVGIHHSIRCTPSIAILNTSLSSICHNDVIIIILNYITSCNAYLYMHGEKSKNTLFQ